MSAVRTLGRVTGAVARRDWQKLMTSPVGAAQVTALARQVRREGLTYLDWPKLHSLEAAIRDLRRRRIYGDFLEAGVALGGSAVLLANRRPVGAAFHGYDVSDLFLSRALTTRRTPMHDTPQSLLESRLGSTATSTTAIRII